MKYKWQLAQAQSSLQSLAQEASHALDLPLWVARILAQRSQFWADSSLSSMERFLRPRLQDLPDPFALKDMSLAVDRVIQAIQKKEKILIYGDYDVDGTVGAAILRRFFRSLGCEPLVFQPDRQKEGYGLNVQAIEDFAKKGVHLLISVDCGISNVVEAKRAKELQMDLIICDHHEVPDPMPQALAVLNHKRKDDSSGIRNLCGAGMAFYLAIAVRSTLRQQKYFKKGPDLRELLDLVAVATIADMVPLLEENRILTHLGLTKLRTHPCVGLRALCECTNTPLGQVSTYHVGFVIGPRINASGRLGSASIALELLSTDDPMVAKDLAQQLHAINHKRIEVQKQVSKEAMEQSAALETNVAGIVIQSDHWHEGVIGIVASRVAEKFHRPVVVVSFKDHMGKGSVRSYKNIDVLACLRECDSLLVKYGGHAAAAGLSVERKNFPAFCKAFAQAVGKQVEALTCPGQTLLDPVISIDMELSQSSLDVESIGQLARLEPFGMGNPRPIIALQGIKVNSSRLLKEEHLKLFLAGDSKDSISTGDMEAIWFYAPKEKQPSAGDSIDLAVIPGVSTFRGRTRLDLQIKDLRQ